MITLEPILQELEEPFLLKDLVTRFAKFSEEVEKYYVLEINSKLNIKKVDTYLYVSGNERYDLSYRTLKDVYEYLTACGAIVNCINTDLVGALPAGLLCDFNNDFTKIIKIEDSPFTITEQYINTSINSYDDTIEVTGIDQEGYDVGLLEEVGTYFADLNKVAAVVYKSRSELFDIAVTFDSLQTSDNFLIQEST